MKRKIVWTIAIVTGIFLILNIKTHTKQGIDRHVRVYRIPLYIKIIEFIDRDYRYKMLAQEISGSDKNEKAKVMSIFQWVRKNIKTDIPDDWSLYDDHIHNTIIRGYGTPDQISDVFNILCMYSKIPAGRITVFIPGNGKGLVLSLVKINKKWCVFDAYRGVYFLNNNKEIASVEDLKSKKYGDKKPYEHISGTELTYDDYFQYIDQYVEDITRRPRLQMPAKRLVYEIKDMFIKDRDRGTCQE